MSTRLLASDARTPTAAALAAIGSLLACADGPRDEGPQGSSEREAAHLLDPPFRAVRELPSPAGAGSVTPSLSATADGSILMSWQEPEGDGDAVRTSRLSDSVWSEPATIAQARDLFVNWADFPSIIELPDGSLAAHWLQREGPGTYAYGVRIARSRDGGRSWSEPVAPHRDGTLTEHGFVSLFPAAGEAVAAVWLDGRDYARAAAADEPEPREAEMALRYAEIEETGRLQAEVVLDPRTCDCCQTSVTITSTGPLLAYRDRSETEIRDIAVVRLVDGIWTSPRAVHEDGWRIPACPVNGPALAGDGDHVVAAWYTAASERPRVLVAFSEDAGAHFAAPLRADEGTPLGRVDVELLPDGSALVLWLEAGEDGARVSARRIQIDGASSPAATVAVTDVSRLSGFPRMALTGSVVVLAWTDTDGTGSAVRTATARLR